MCAVLRAGVQMGVHVHMYASVLHMPVRAVSAPVFVRVPVPVLGQAVRADVCLWHAVLRHIVSARAVLCTHARARVCVLVCVHVRACMRVQAHGFDGGLWHL